MQQFKRRTAAAAAALIVTTLMAGCGGGSGDSATDLSSDLIASEDGRKINPNKNKNSATPVVTTPTEPVNSVGTTWTRCATEGGVCNFSGTASVRYGLDDRFATLSATDSIACNNTVFGDPYPGVAKICEYSGTASAPVASAPPASTGGSMKGVNLSGAEFNNHLPNAALHSSYIYPSNAEIDYYAAKGMKLIRLPLSGARIQPVSNSALSAGELEHIFTFVDYAASKGMQVVIDPHDYGMKYDSSTGTMRALGTAGGLPASHFADFWSRLATAFKSRPNVIFGLMNEPANQSAIEWKNVAVAGVNAIRATGATQKILIPGASWTGAHSWINSGNAAAWAGFSDPGNNFAFEMHQYLDSDSSGTNAACVSGAGSARLVEATKWARANGYKVFLGEIGWSAAASCTPEAKAAMAYMSNNADVWEGWAYWAAGPWYPADYMFMLDPVNLSQPVDRPQMSILAEHL